MPNQPKTDYYKQFSYDSKRRFISYWHQIQETASVQPKRVLEIGVGRGFVKEYLIKRNINVITLDIDPGLNPSVVGDLAQGTPFQNQSFDVVMACEVLEHMPYSQIPNVLKEISRIARYAVISIPNNTPWYKIDANLPIIGRIKFFYERHVTVNRNFSEDKRGHYWEIGVNNIMLEDIKSEIIKHFKILKSYRVPEHPAHHFFLLKSAMEDSKN